MQMNSIQNVLSFGLVILVLSGCSQKEIEQVPVIETRTVQVARPAPIVPSVDQLQMRDVQWLIITPDNVDEVFGSLTGDVVLFALTDDGYEALSLNLSDIRASIQQYKQIIAIYRSSYR